jgi:hypothetical protein
MPLLAFNRKDTGDESIGRLGLWAADLANCTGKRFHYGGIVAGAPGIPGQPHAIVVKSVSYYIAS